MLKRLRAERNKKGNKKGFTLVELLIVIAILGIMVAVLVPTMMSGLDKASQSKYTQRIASVQAVVNTAISSSPISAADQAKYEASVTKAFGGTTTLTGITGEDLAQDGNDVKAVSAAALADTKLTIAKPAEDKNTLFIAVPQLVGSTTTTVTWLVELTGIANKDLSTAEGVLIALPTKNDDGRVAIQYYATIYKKGTVLFSNSEKMAATFSETAPCLITITLTK
ncbi:MAG: prepilin-type N-terminal cleavage/methylation domain-containing protein [Clostridia bacterium]